MMHHQARKCFQLCPIVFNYAQHIFPMGAKNFAWEASPPLRTFWLRACASQASRFVLCANTVAHLCLQYVLRVELRHHLAVQADLS